MAVPKSELLSRCRTAFGGDPEKTLSLLTTKLEMLKLRLGQVYWVGTVKSESGEPLLQVGLNIPRGTRNAKRKIRFNKHFQTILDETKEPKPDDLGFKQQPSRSEEALDRIWSGASDEQIQNQQDPRIAMGD